MLMALNCGAGLDSAGTRRWTGRWLGAHQAAEVGQRGVLRAVIRAPVRDSLCAPGIGDEPIVADAVKAAGQNMVSAQTAQGIAQNAPAALVIIAPYHGELPFPRCVLGSTLHLPVLQFPEFHGRQTRFS